MPYHFDILPFSILSCMSLQPWPSQRLQSYVCLWDSCRRRRRLTHQGSASVSVKVLLFLNILMIPNV